WLLLRSAEQLAELNAEQEFDRVIALPKQLNLPLDKTMLLDSVKYLFDTEEHEANYGAYAYKLVDLMLGAEQVLSNDVFKAAGAHAAKFGGAGIERLAELLCEHGQE